LPEKVGSAWATPRMAPEAAAMDRSTRIKIPLRWVE